MQLHRLANTELDISPLAFGCWGIISDNHWGQREEAESLSAISAAIDLGINFFDTAAMYGDGQSELLLGKAIANRRDKVIIASKMKPGELQAAQIQIACDRALERLGTDYLDLWQIHWPDPTMPIQETWDAMCQLRDAGKVRYLGVCNFGVRDLTTMTDLPEMPATNQLPYSPVFRAIEFDLLPYCLNHRVDVLVYSPLMHGLLADKYDEPNDVPVGRARTRHFSRHREQTRHNEDGCEVETFRAVLELREIARRLGIGSATLTLRWLLAKRGIGAIIVGARNAKQVAQNMESVADRLPQEVEQQVDRLTEPLRQAMGTNVDLWQAGDAGRIN